MVPRHEFSWSHAGKPTLNGPNFAERFRFGRGWEGISVMRLGLLADIHEDVERLGAAIALCRREGVDRLLTLGDIFETGERFAEAVELLRGAEVGGVWGNHELALYVGRGDSVESAFDWRTLDYMRRLEARLEVEGVLLGHVLPSLDPTDVAQPWYVEPPPVTTEAAARNFAAYPHRRMFVGHYHQWLAITPAGPLAWDGSRPIAFEHGCRYLVVIAAVFEGWCAIHDTEADRLTPFRIRCAR
jgi:hypothetical protein